MTSSDHLDFQDDEEVWLGGGAEYHARPILSHSDPHFQVWIKIVHINLYIPTPTNITQIIIMSGGDLHGLFL